MAHFAHIDDTNTVTNVIVISNDVVGDTYPESEPIGQQFIADVLGFDGTWLQTSFHANFRKQYAGIGSIYYSDADVFIGPKPFPSWVLDSNYDWVAPVPCPTEGQWMWDEEVGDWVETLAGLH